MRTGPTTRDTTAIALGLAQIRVGKSAPNIANINPVLVAADSLGALANTGLTGETNFFEFESGFPKNIDAVFPLSETNMLECAFQEITPKNLALSRGIDVFANISATVVAGTVSSAAGTTTGDMTVTDAGGVVNDTWTIVFTSATAYSVFGNVSGHVGDGTISVLFEPDNAGNPYFGIPTTFFTGTWAADDSYTFTTTEYVAGTSAYADNHSGAIALGTVAAPEFIRVEAVYTFPNAIDTMTIIFPRANAVSSTAIDLQSEDAAAVALQLKSMSASSDVSGGNAVWDGSANAGPQGRIVFA